MVEALVRADGVHAPRSVPEMWQNFADFLRRISVRVISPMRSRKNDRLRRPRAPSKEQPQTLSARMRFHSDVVASMAPV